MDEAGQREKLLLRDVFALLALPPLWQGQQRHGILASLCEALEALTAVDLVYAWTPAADPEQTIEMLRIHGEDVTASMPRWRPVLRECCGKSIGAVHEAVLDELGPLRLVDSPLGSRGELGNVLVGCRRDLEAATSLVPILRIASSLATTGLEGARVGEEREAERQVLATMVRTSELLGHELAEGPLLQKVTDEATRLCRAEFGAFSFETTDARSQPHGSRALHASFAAFPQPWSDALLEANVRDDGVVRVADLRHAPGCARDLGFTPPLGGEQPVVSYMAVPVKLATGDVVGRLVFGHSRANVFQRSDEELVVAVAAQAAVALDNARLYEQAQATAASERDRAELMEHVGRAILGSAEIAETLTGVCGTLVARLGSALACVWVLDESTGDLELCASAGTDSTLGDPRKRLRVGEGEIGEVAATRQPGRIDDLATDPRTGDREWIQRERLVAFAGYPLVVGERLLGVLALFARGSIAARASALIADVGSLMALSLERARIEGEREQFREIFIGMLGHDLRNPLSAIKTSAETLRIGVDAGARQYRIADRIVRSSERMTRMIVQLLDFTRARSGVRFPLDVRACDLFEICDDTVEELRAAHPERSVRVSHQGSGDGLWDSDRMAQVFSNLVGNALQHSPDGTSVDVSLVQDGEAMQCRVTSHGEPIPPDTMATLFDPFRRGPDHRKVPATRGLGLGLFITKHVIAAHGGSIRVSSTREGTAFEFRVARRGARELQ